MKERPILFSAAMVRAILEGRKTQTRRVMKPQPDDDGKIIVGKIGGNRGVAYVGNSTSGGIVTRVPCPYGRPGDLLYVRETWQAWDRVSVEYNEWERWTRERRGGLSFDAYREEHGNPSSIEYRATSNSRGPWTPAIHMPRWASRITLRLTDVRVERVQDISEEDAIAEGITGPHDVGYRAYRVPGDSKPRYSSAVAAFEAINTERDCGWDANPWVWVLVFEPVHKEAV